MNFTPLLSSPRAKTHTPTHGYLQCTCKHTHLRWHTQRHTCTGKSNGTCTHTSPLARANSYTGSKAWCNFSCPSPFWPAVNVNYKTLWPQVWDLHILYTSHDPQRDTSSIKKNMLHTFAKDWTQYWISISSDNFPNLEDCTCCQKIWRVSVLYHKLMIRLCSVHSGKVTKLKVLEKD